MKLWGIAENGSPGESIVRWAKAPPQRRRLKRSDSILNRIRPTAPVCRVFARPPHGKQMPDKNTGALVTFAKIARTRDCHACSPFFNPARGTLPSVRFPQKTTISKVTHIVRQIPLTLANTRWCQTRQTRQHVPTVWIVLIVLKISVDPDMQSVTSR